MIPTGGQYPEKTFSQEFSACNQIGLGRWTRGNSGYLYQREDSLPVHTVNGGNASSSALAGSQGESAAQPDTPSSAATQEPPKTLPERNQGGQEAAASESSDAGGGIAEQIWGNPFLWAGIAAVLVAAVVLVALFLHNRREKRCV